MNALLLQTDTASPMLADAQQATCSSIIYNAVPVALCLLDTHLRILSSNRRMTEITVSGSQDIVGRSLFEVMPGIAAQLEPDLSRALRGERVADLELASIGVDNTRESQTFLISIEPLSGSTGEVQGVPVLCPRHHRAQASRGGTAGK